MIFLGCSIWLYLFCILIDIEIEIFLNGHDIVILNVKIFFLDPPLDFQTVCIYDLTLKGCSFIPYLLQCQPQIQRNLLYKDESVCVCVYVRWPAVGPTQAVTPKFGVGSSFHPGSAPSQGATQNVDPRGTPYSDPL